MIFFTTSQLKKRVFPFTLFLGVTFRKSAPASPLLLSVHGVKSSAASRTPLQHLACLTPAERQRHSSCWVFGGPARGRLPHLGHRFTSVPLHSSNKVVTLGEAPLCQTREGLQGAAVCQVLTAGSTGREAAPGHQHGET